jgi:hypothetical protein
MKIDKDSVYCSLQRALIGYVTPNLRAVSVEFEEERKYKLNFFYDKQPSEEEEELASLAETEFIADHPAPDYIKDCKIYTVNYPKPIRDRGDCVYKRYEEISKIDSWFSWIKKFQTAKQPILVDRGSVLRAIQKALLGNVTPNLRAVYLNYENEREKKYILNFFYDRSPSAIEIELANLTYTSFCADFTSDYKVDVKIETVPFPEMIPMRLHCVYERYEKLTP